MSPSKLILLLIVVTLIANVECWRRRRRRRHRCHPVNCVTSWGPWSACNCLGKRTRTLRIVSQPSCGGAACPRPYTQTGACGTGSCVFGSGYCNVRTATCKCLAGRTGTRCEKPCPAGKFGLNCRSTCNCVAGIGCDPVSGYCKCPIGRSGRRCQHRYRCPRNNRCYRLKPTLVNYNLCYLQVKVSNTVRGARVTCPRRTHYANRCICYRNCLPSTLIKSQTCQCNCRAPRSAHSSYRGKFVTQAICCPRHPFF